VYIPNDSKFRANILRLFVKNSEDGAAEPYLRIGQVTREGDEVRIDLPEGREALETGWFPEIVHRFGSEADTMDLVVSPRVVHPVVEGPEATAETAEITPPVRRVKGGGEDVLYEVTFVDREIRINGAVLSKPHYDSENELVFNHLFRNPGRKVDLSEIEAELKRPVRKRLGEIVRDLGFRKELREMFFPDISKSAVRFVNPITRADFSERGLRPPRISTA